MCRSMLSSSFSLPCLISRREGVGGGARLGKPRASATGRLLLAGGLIFDDVLVAFAMAIAALAAIRMRAL